MTILKYYTDWPVLTEILHTCFLGEYLGVFFSFFRNCDFWGLRASFRQNEVKSFWAAWSFQKRSDLAEILHTYWSLGEYLGCFFHFSKKVNLICKVSLMFCYNATIGPSNNLKLLKLRPVRCARLTILDIISKR